jgi:hypothetical protein
MAHYSGIVQIRVAAAEDVIIRPAHTDTPDADQNLTNLRDRSGT